MQQNFNTSNGRFFFPIIVIIFYKNKLYIHIKYNKFKRQFNRKTKIEIDPINFCNEILIRVMEGIFHFYYNYYLFFIRISSLFTINAINLRCNLMERLKLKKMQLIFVMKF